MSSTVRHTDGIQLSLEKSTRAALTVLFAAVSLASVGACTQAAPKAEFTCANIDWYETGRTEGTQGLRYERILEHQKRCEGSPNQVDVDLYTNGRDLGLVEFCTATGGMSAGRSGLPYDGVCPGHLEKRFLSGYEIGKRIRQLEEENADLEWRLNGLVKQDSSQFNELKERRAKIDAEITTLENQPSQANRSL